jgi:hypothetical protein
VKRPFEPTDEQVRLQNKVMAAIREGACNAEGLWLSRAQCEYLLDTIERGQFVAVFDSIERIEKMLAQLVYLMSIRLETTGSVQDS